MVTELEKHTDTSDNMCFSIRIAHKLPFIYCNIPA